MHTEELNSKLSQFFLFKIHGRRFLIAAGVGVLLVGVAGWFWPPALWAFVMLAPIVLIGLWDLYFSSNTILRNFPFFGHFRYLFLRISPEIHQYFVENNTEGKPFSKIQRNMVNRRADQRLETHPFGTEEDVYHGNYEWLPHSIYPRAKKETAPRIRIGGPACRQPYEAALLNISAMSYGSLSASAVRALNVGAQAGNFFHNTGEGGLSPYHEAAGADLVWEIGSGYFGCRDEDGNFNDQMFRETAAKPVVKMIEIKLSQGAKPGHGGVLPAPKVTPEIARIRNVEPYTKVVSPAFHKTFSDAPGLLAFVERLRDLSEGKPVGFKLCVGEKSEFEAICLAMIETGIRPDFITVDGGEGGTGAAPPEFSDSVGMPLVEALVFVTDMLNGYDLKQEIRVIASGKIVSAFDMIKAMALGADLCNSARGMMLALGCIQALKCDTDECPTGITTHNPHLTRGLVVADKARRVTNFQKETVQATLELLAGMGLDSFTQLQRHHINKRIDFETMKSFAEIYPPVACGHYLPGQ
ncbi:MAG: FMN-binding glutamate synthase family protein [Desulfuromonadales bacterium]